MTNQTTTGTPGADPGAPGAAGQPPATQQTPSQTTDWEARYKGQVTANSKQALEMQALREQLAQKEQQIAALLGEKDTLDATWQTKLQESQQAFLNLKETSDAAAKDHVATNAELAKFRALAQHPELMMYADLITPTTVQAELEAQLAKVQQIHTQSLEAARQGLQQQGFAPPAAPPATPPGAVTEATLEKALNEAKEDLRIGKITRDEFFRKSAELGEQYNLLQQGKGGGQ